MTFGKQSNGRRIVVVTTALAVFTAYLFLPYIRAFVVNVVAVRFWRYATCYLTFSVLTAQVYYCCLHCIMLIFTNCNFFISTGPACSMHSYVIFVIFFLDLGYDVLLLCICTVRFLYTVFYCSLY